MATLGTDSRASLGGRPPRSAWRGVARALAGLCLLASACDDCERSAEDRSSEEGPTAGSQGAKAKAPGTVSEPVDDEPASEGSVSDELIAIDTHVDTTQRMLDGDDIAERLEGGHLDLPRMRAGGLTGAFFSVWVNPRKYRGDAAWARALALTGAIRAVPERHPELAVLCTSAADVRRSAKEGRAALLIGVEGGHALGTDDPELALQRLGRLHELGARYMTITWSTDNPLGHSSTGKHPERGLTDLGRRVVREMNRLGMIVDVSHVSDRTFSDIMDVTQRPVIASHSSARALADHPRNMTDEMIRRVADGGGAVCINYYSSYIDIGYRNRRKRLEREHAERFKKLGARFDDWGERGVATAALARELDPGIDPPTVATLADHFAHAAEVGGADAVCLGSDFDGVPELPVGLPDVSALGALRAELEQRGLPLRPIFGENVLRVLQAQAPNAD